MNDAPNMVASEQKREPAEIATKVYDTDFRVKIKREIGGPRGPEPTRYGDWERKGRCIDF